MLKSKVLDYFATSRSTGAVAVAARLGMSRQAVYRWGEHVPEHIARRLEKLTKGELAVNESLYARMRAADSARRRAARKRGRS